MPNEIETVPLFFFSQARISLLQDEVSTNGIEDDALKVWPHIVYLSF